MGIEAPEISIIPGVVSPELVPVALLAPGFDEVSGHENEIWLAFLDEAAVFAVADGLIDEVVLEIFRAVAMGGGGPIDPGSGRGFRFSFRIGIADKANGLIRAGVVLSVPVCFSEPCWT